MVKIRSKREIDLMMISNQIVAETLDLVSQFIEPGTSLKKLDSIAEEHIRSQGGRPAFKGYLGYPATLCISIDDAVVHGIPNGDVLREGQIVGIDCGVEKEGYFGDHARTFAVGEIDPEKQKLINITLESLDIGIGKAVEGNYVSDIGHAIQSFIEARGYSVVRELVGHGIGTELHEEPQVPNFGPPKKGYRLKTGMCLAIEPMINMGSKDVYTDRDGWTVRTKDGKPSAHFEHTIAVLEDSPTVLSQRKNHA